MTLLIQSTTLARPSHRLVEVYDSDAYLFTAVSLESETGILVIGQFTFGPAAEMSLPRPGVYEGQVSWAGRVAGAEYYEHALRQIEDDRSTARIRQPLKVPRRLLRVRHQPARETPNTGPAGSTPTGSSALPASEATRVQRVGAIWPSASLPDSQGAGKRQTGNRGDGTASVAEVRSSGF
ncbi:hypothetical protein [Streptomyces virginiae]